MRRMKALALLFVCYAVVVLLRLTAPSEMDNRNQSTQGLYVIDVVKNGSFFLPTVQDDEPATKPPLYNWIAAAISLAWGDVTELTVKAPSVLSGLGVVIITFLVGETLFSLEVGVFAGLVLILSYHFTTLTSIVRTDMMLCFFVSLSLYFFLLAYQRRPQQSIYSVLAFGSIGLGSITKGPVALALPFLTLLVFLFFRKDLKWLKSMRLGWGLAIWLLIMLGWFVPALLKGGREFFDIVVYDEMVNRFLGIGTRAEKAQPFYYLIPHFFGKFLPWSLFVPLGIAHYWKSKDEAERGALLFPIAWFLTIFVFFSVSRGKRPDYILPLYPAAAVIVAHFWVYLVGQPQTGRWERSAHALSLGYLGGSFLMIAGMVLLLAGAGPILAVARLIPHGFEEMGLLQDTLRSRTHIFLLAAIPLAAASILGATFALKRKAKPLLIVMLVAAGLNTTMYFEIFSPSAIRLSGGQKKAFCAKVIERIKSTENLRFCRTNNSILFYLGKNDRFLSHDEALRFLSETDSPYLIATEQDYIALRERADFELTVLEQSEYLIRDKRRYVLLTKKKADAEPEAGTYD